MPNATLPTFTLDIQHIEPSLDKYLHNCRNAIATTILPKTHTWTTLTTPMDVAEDQLSQFFSPVSHINAVCNTPELREVYEKCLSKLSAYHTEVGQNQELYEAYQRFEQSIEYKTLDRAQQKVIQDALLGFKLSGIALPEAQKARFKEIQQQLSQLTTQFENHVMDATDHWQYHTDDVKTLSGLPESTLHAAQEKAKTLNKTGYVLGIDFPTYHAVMTYADHRELREQFYTAYQTRASDQGPDAGKWDNGPVMTQLLALRQEEAMLLGFKNYAELSLASKMAPSTKRVTQFLEDLGKKSKPFAQRELTELQAFAKSLGFSDPLKSWDIAYYSEKLKEKEYQISQEALRAYFPVDQVMQGLFQLIGILFGITFQKIDAPTWHPDVTVYALQNTQQETFGHLYVDLYARTHKRSGAWMDDGRTRWRLPNGSLQDPLAYLTCNFMPPTAENPALLTFDDVETLFHEMGHCLHHLLSQVDYVSVSGIHGVKWDAVELPSQFLENFCWQKPVIDLISKHYETGAPLPENQLKQLQKARTFQSGMMMTRQMELSLFDFELYQHNETLTPEKIQKALDQVRQKVSVITPPSFARFQNSFSHIFAGGYSAGYYSYKWAEVLSADAFAAFEEEGVLNPKTGQRFLNTILSKGGSEEPMKLFVDFRGREPTIEALLKHQGLN